MKSFYSSLALCSSKPAILALVEPYSTHYFPESLDSKLPICLSQLFRSECLQMNYGELLNLAEKWTVAITAEKTRLAEEQTRGQATSRLWSECVPVE